MKAYIEQDCTIEHDGRKYTAGGAIVTPDFILAYVGKRLPDDDTHHPLTDWHDNIIGTCRLTSSWRINSYLSHRMYQIWAIVDGRTYTGRGMGTGMSCKLRPAKRQP